MKEVKTYCFQCYNGPDPFKMIVKDGIVRNIEPDFDCRRISPGEGRVCVKAYGLVQKMYNSNRIKAPLIRTNPKKGKGEDPGFREASWDEALDLVSERLGEIRKRGLLDDKGYPRLAVSMGEAGSPAGYGGTFPALLSSWGPIDFTLGGGEGSKCYHSEHLYGELWHRAFIVASDTPRNKWILSFGHNTNASAGVSGAMRHADARERGYKRIQVEPHLSVSATTSDEWIPIKTKTDAPFMYGMLNAILHEMDWRKVCDLDFIKKRTNSPYLIGPRGYYLRDPETREILVWDSMDNCPRIYNDPSVKDFALNGRYRVRAMERGPDGEEWFYEEAGCSPAFDVLLEHMKPYTPDWASEICDVPASTIRRLAREMIDSACIGKEIEICGEKVPLRPVAITLGKTVNNGPGGYQACWARTVLAMLTGSLEVAGGSIGASQRLNRPHHDRWSSIWPGEDGFFQNFLNPTDTERRAKLQKTRSHYTELVPLVGNTGWSPFLSPVPHAWLWFKDTPENWEKPTYPDVWIIYRTNPNMSMYYTDIMEETTKDFPFIVSFGYTLDETNWYADVILPEHTDLEGLQLFRLGPSTHSEAYWEEYGFALRQPGVQPPYNTMDLTDICTELADRVGILKEYNEAINAGIMFGIRLQGRNYNHMLDPERKYPLDEIWDRLCRASVRLLTNGKEERDLQWFRENGYFTVPYPFIRHFLHPVMVKWGLRYEIPYQGRLRVIGEELRKRLQEKGVTWWEEQLKEYEALPGCEDFSRKWEESLRGAGRDPEEYPFFMINTRSMQYAWGSNASLPIMAEVAGYVTGFGGIVINASVAEDLEIEDGDMVVVESPVKKRSCKAIVREGIRPDTVLVTGQFGNWAVPFAKDLNIPNMNEFMYPDQNLFDAGGSSADIAKVKISKAGPDQVQK
ncbi:MAG TPA: molybdopterin oxidoreductase [Nitrospirae bacterium]|nr:putative dimethyl sulfoxide reductase chain YnfF precursor [bacterium BMS3Abin08]HDY70980.1 molybdopterin oxidoreductase [Nitrospirota bacterium]